MPRFSLATASRALTHSPSGLRYIGSAIDRSKVGAIPVFLLQASSLVAISDLSTSGVLPFGTRRLTASLKALSSIPTYVREVVSGPMNASAKPTPSLPPR
ncbi:hypothetical protein D3C78_1627860 [compost metagenome]